MRRAGLCVAALGFLCLLPNATPTSSAQTGFAEIPLRPAANQYLTTYYQQPPSSPVALGGVPFNLGGGGNPNMAVFPESVAATGTVVPTVTNPLRVHLLINTYNTYSVYKDQSVGTVRLGFDDASTYELRLVIGQNVREWRQGDDLGATVNTVTDSNNQQVFSGSPVQYSGPAVIDKLAIDVPGAYQTKTLVSVSVTNSVVPLAPPPVSAQPSIFWDGVTVEAIPIAMSPQVVVCTDAFFQGACEAFSSDDPDLSNNVVGIDTISAIHVPSGQIASLYTGYYYGGICETFTSDLSDFRNDTGIGNDTARSIRVGAACGPPSLLPWPENEQWYYYCGPHSTQTACPSQHNSSRQPSTESLDFGPVPPNDSSLTCPRPPDLSHTVAAIGPGKILERPGDAYAGQYVIALGTWSGSPPTRGFTPSGIAAVYEHVYIDPNDLPAKGAEVAASAILGNPSCLGITSKIHVHVGFFKCLSGHQCADETAPFRTNYIEDNFPESGVTLCGFKVNGDNTLQRGSAVLKPNDPVAASPITCGGIGSQSAGAPQHAVIVPGQTVQLQTTVPPASTFVRWTWQLFFGGSAITMKLVTPDQTVINQYSTFNGAYFESPGWRHYEISQPQPGTWTIELYGADVAAQGESATLMVEGCAQAAGDAAGDPCVGDDDADGCSDARELGSDWHTGGQRDPLNPWDFFDVPVPALTSANPTGVRNKVVSIQDVIAIVYYIGTWDGGSPNINGVSYNSDLNSNSTKDGSEYDRTPSTTPGQPWRSGPPNGAVSIQDAIVALNQVGTNCV